LTVQTKNFPFLTLYLSHSQSVPYLSPKQRRKTVFKKKVQFKKYESLPILEIGFLSLKLVLIVPNKHLG